MSECIVAVSRQCMLMFSVDPSQDTPPDWHRKAQLRDLCRSMPPIHFVDCMTKLYEHLCDFLYKHQFLCRWHEFRAQGVDTGCVWGSARGALDVGHRPWRWPVAHERARVIRGWPDGSTKLRLPNFDELSVGRALYETRVHPPAARRAHACRRGTRVGSQTAHFWKKLGLPERQQAGVVHKNMCSVP